MSNRKIGVIVNPAAGGGKGIRQIPLVVKALQRLEAPHHLHVTTARGDATAVARRFAGAGLETIIVVGGDGTINEVANGLISLANAPAIGIVPAGRGSDLVRNLGAPTDVDQAVNVSLEGSRRCIDTILATFSDGTSRYFVNAGGLGFDAAVAEMATRSRMPGSTLPYLHGVLGALVRYRNVPITITIDGEDIAGTTCLALVANGERLGGGMKLVPGASLDDGLFDVAIVGDISKLDLLRNMPRIYRGTHVNHRMFTHRTARSIRIATSSPVAVQLDGELVGTSPVTFTVVPNSLRVAG